MDELTEERKVTLRTRQTELISLLDALGKLNESEEWHVLKKSVFDKSVDSIEKQMLTECIAKVIDTSHLYRLQGEWMWAKQYSDNRLANNLKVELENIKKIL